MWTDSSHKIYCNLFLFSFAISPSRSISAALSHSSFAHTICIYLWTWVLKTSSARHTTVPLEPNRTKRACRTENRTRAMGRNAWTRWKFYGFCQVNVTMRICTFLHFSCDCNDLLSMCASTEHAWAWALPFGAHQKMSKTSIHWLTNATYIADFVVRRSRKRWKFIVKTENLSSKILRMPNNGDNLSAHIIQIPSQCTAPCNQLRFRMHHWTIRWHIAIRRSSGTMRKRFESVACRAAYVRLSFRNKITHSVLLRRTSNCILLFTHLSGTGTKNI